MVFNRDYAIATELDLSTDPLTLNFSVLHAWRKKIIKFFKRRPLTNHHHHHLLALLLKSLELIEGNVEHFSEAKVSYRSRWYAGQVISDPGFARYTFQVLRALGLEFADRDELANSRKSHRLVPHVPRAEAEFPYAFHLGCRTVTVNIFPVFNIWWVHDAMVVSTV